MIETHVLLLSLARNKHPPGWKKDGFTHERAVNRGCVLVVRNFYIVTSQMHTAAARRGCSEKNSPEDMVCVGGKRFLAFDITAS